MFKKEDKNELRKVKHNRSRFTLSGTAENYGSYNHQNQRGVL